MSNRFAKKTSRIFVSLPAISKPGNIDTMLFAQLLRARFPNNPVRTLFQVSKRRKYFKKIISDAFHGFPISERYAKILANLLGLKRCEVFGRKGSVLIEVSVTVL